MLKPLLLIAIVLLVLTLGLYGYLYLWSGDRLRSPEELTRVALTGGSDADKEQAALDLARSGEAAREPLRRVLAESSNPDVRAAAIQGLGELRDGDSLPDLIKLLEDPSDKVRGRAGVAVGNIIGIDFRFNATDSQTGRAKAVKAIKQAYEAYKKNPPPKDPESS